MVTIRRQTGGKVQKKVGLDSDHPSLASLVYNGRVVCSRNSVCSQTGRDFGPTPFPKTLFTARFSNDQTNDGFFVLDPCFHRAVVCIALFCDAIYCVCAPIGRRSARHVASITG